MIPDSPTDTRETERDGRGRFRPGNTTSKLGGRPPAPVEAELYAAAVEGAGGAVGVREVMAVVAKKALEGSAPHAAIFARVLKLYRDDPRPLEGDTGHGLGDLLSRPGAVEKVSQLMDELFGNSVVPGREHLPEARSGHAPSP